DRDASNEEVIEFIREEADAAFDRTFQVLRTRVNLFGVAQPNIQKLTASDRILVELPGVKNKERVRQLLQGTAKLEFWETYENAEIYPYLAKANEKLNLIQKSEEVDGDADSTSAIADIADTLGQEVEEVAEEVVETAENALDSLTQDTVEEESSLMDQLASDADTSSSDSAGLADQSFEDFAKDNPLFAVLSPAIYQNEQGNYMPGEGPIVGYVAIKDTAKVNEYLAMPEIKKIFPNDLRLLWTA